MMEGLQEWLTQLFGYSVFMFQDKSRERGLEMTLHPKGETKAERFIQLNHELIIRGQEPRNSQSCLLFSEYFLINSLFTTKPAWSNRTHLLRILSSGLHTGSEEETRIPQCFFKQSWIPWLDAMADFFSLLSRWSWSWNPHLSDRLSGLWRVHPPSQTTAQLRGCLAEENPDTLGQRLPNRRGKKTQLCIVSKLKSSSKTHVPSPISSRASILSCKPALLLLFQDESVISFT